MDEPDVNPKINIAMILAAGYGTRMEKLTEDLPKPMLPLNSYRLIEVALHKLAYYGFQRVVINLHYFPEKISSYLGNGQAYGLEIRYSREEKLLGSEGGIANAKQYFNDEIICVLNADVLTNLNIGQFFEFHLRESSLATMAVLPSTNNHDYSLVLFDKRNNLCGFLKKNQPIPPNFQAGIFTGYQILTPQAWHSLKLDHKSIITHFYQEALQRGGKLKIYPFVDHWIDVGTKAHYEAIVRQVQSGKINLQKYMR